MPTTDSPEYSIIFRNRSGLQHDFVCFQHAPGHMGPDTGRALAWLCRSVPNNVDDTITWTLTFDFVWMEVGALSNGINSTANEVIPADLAAANQIGLTFKDGAFQFTKPSSKGKQGSLTIDCDSTIPPNEAVVGIGMSGSPTFALQAVPNLFNVIQPRPEFWITYGDFKSGQALSKEAIARAVQVTFPTNIYEVTATLKNPSPWQIEPTPP